MSHFSGLVVPTACIKLLRSELQIRGGIEYNSKMIFLISQGKCCDLSLEPSRRDGFNDGSQNMLLIMEKYG